MNYYKKTFMCLFILLPVFLAANIICEVASLSGSTYTLQMNSNCVNGWRVSPNTSEDYTFCWVFSDGSYVRNNGYTGSLTASAPNTSITQLQYQAYCSPGEKLMHTTVTNRYGDDTDKKRVAGGPVPNGMVPTFNKVPLNQANMTAPTLTQIQTDHGNIQVAKGERLMLILTVNNDHINNLDSLGYQLPDEGYVLRLYHKNNFNYGFIPGETSAYPSGQDQYFAFAPLNTSSYSHGNPSYSYIRSWSIQNNFQGHEKNVYCLLTVPTVAGYNYNTPIIDSFVAILTNSSNQLVQNSESKLRVEIGKSHDPNVIEVNIPTSTQCGPDANGVQEELEYTVHFQNIGSDPATTVEVNLDIDPHLNNSSLTVTEIGIGTNPPVAGGASISQARTGYNGLGGTFEYSVGTSNTAYNTSLLSTQIPSIIPDAKFLFSGIQLAGINAANVQDSKGYIKFKIKTAGAYQVIHNQAGIFFDHNPEIVTNLAETRCLKDSINMNCDSCRMHLKECRDQFNGSKTDSSNGWMNWLGWIIAGIELLIIVYLLTRKRN